MMLALKAPGDTWLLQFFSPLPSHEGNCPTSNKNKLQAFLSYPLKTAHMIVIKDMPASILHADTTSSVHLDMAKVYLSKRYSLCG